jgi:hypothetical protein
MASKKRIPDGSGVGRFTFTGKHDSSKVPASIIVIKYL